MHVKNYLLSDQDLEEKKIHEITGLTGRDDLTKIGKTGSRIFCILKFIFARSFFLIKYIIKSNI